MKMDIWYLVLLFSASTILLQHQVSNLLHETSSELRCTFSPDVFGASDKMETLHSCSAQLHGGKIRIRCSIYGYMSITMPPLSKATLGILLTDYMESSEHQDDIVTQPRSSSCLKFLSSRIQKHSESDPEIMRRYNTYLLSAKSFSIPLLLIEKIDMIALFNSDYAVGIVHYNKTCLWLINNDASKQQFNNDSLDVSSCISFVNVLQRFVAPRSSFKFDANISFILDLQKVDFLSVILTIVDEMFLVGYNGSVPYLAFKAAQFGTLPTDALKILSQRQVISIDFHSNKFHTIGNGHLPQMNSLRQLDLSNCQIGAIELNAFDGAVSLSHLNLKGNKLKELPFALQPLHKLENLDLGSNADEFQYKKNILNNNSNIRSLALSNMVLSGFWENLGNLSKLERLDLSNCSIRNIPMVHISNIMPNLIHLNLSNNNLNDINAHFFSGLNKLQSLDLSKNFLSQFRYNTTIGILPSLINISLNRNGVRELLPLTLPSDSTLWNLDLSFNNINSWNKTKLHMSERILTLDLVGNNLTEVNSPMIQDFNTLMRVALAENTFDCKSCNMKNFLEWIKSTNTSTDFQNSSFTCFFPKEYFKKAITEVSPELCNEVPFNWINVVIPIAVIVVFLAALTGVAIAYRWQITYFIYLFLSQIKKHRERQDDSVFKFDAFVSYCTADQNWVAEQLVPSIETQEPELHLCVHERDFEVGDTIMNNIIDCIDNCHKSIFVLSQHFIESQWCRWELQMAQHKLFEDKRDVLILIMFGKLNEKEMPKLLKRLIATQTYLQWPEHENGHKLFYKRLKDSIGQCQCIKSIKH